MPPRALSEARGFNAELAEGWNAGVEAGLRYWGTFGRLAVESFTALVPLVAEFHPTDHQREEVVAAAPVPLPAERTILVEAEAGQSGVGVFLVENTTAEQLSAPVGNSPFHDPRGREVHPTIAFRPEVVTLDPGDQQVVQVAALLDESLEPGVRYHASISVAGLPANGIPIVVRRSQGAAPRVEPQAKATTTSS